MKVLVKQRLLVDGKQVEPGQTIELPDEQVEHLGDAVTPAKHPKKPAGDSDKQPNDDINAGETK
jgi:hypothetical protein